MIVCAYEGADAGIYTYLKFQKMAALNCGKEGGDGRRGREREKTTQFHE